MAATATPNIMMNLVASMNAASKPATSSDAASATAFGDALTQQLQAHQSQQLSQSADPASHQPQPEPLPAAAAPAANGGSNPSASANQNTNPAASNPAQTQQAQATATPANSAANDGNRAGSTGKSSDSGKAAADRKTGGKDTSQHDDQATDAATAGAAASVLSQLQNLVNGKDSSIDLDTAGGATRTGGLGDRLLGAHDPKAIAEREIAAGGDTDLSATTDDKLAASLKLDVDRQVVSTGTSTAASQASFAELLDRKLQVADAGQIRQQMVTPTTARTDARAQAADTAKPSASIYQAVGAEGWDSALGTKVVMMVSNQQQEVELHLNPPHLGPIDVKLSLDQDQATVTFVAAHANVRDAIQSSVPTLNQMLAESGIQLAQTNVQARNQEAGGQPSGQGNRSNGKQAEREESKIAPVGWQPRAVSGLPGNVNLFI